MTLSVLADGDRLRLFSAIALAGDAGCALTAACAAAGVGARDASKHCARLVSSGLVRHADGVLVAVPAAFRDDGSTAGAPEGLPPSLFDRAGRVTTIPRGRDVRAAFLAWLAEGFRPGRRYTEGEVNAVLAARHDDHVALRRYLVDAGLLERTDDGDAYWRVPG